MASLGLHVFNPTWYAGYHSASFAECTLSLFDSHESIAVPVQVCTKVSDVKKAIADIAMVEPDSLTFLIKQGCYWKVQSDHCEIGRKVIIKGLKSFDPQPHRWPHTKVIIGAGYNGIKTALLYLHHGSNDFVMFERYDRVGGHAWLTQANKTSKLQTDMAAFHVWFGKEWAENERLGYPVDWSNWPGKEEVLRHLQHACDQYGIMPHLRFKVNVKSMDIVGKPTDDKRHYVLHVHPLDDGGVPSQVEASAFYHFPGAYFNPRIITYPGEETFDGHIGYGMNDDIPYEHLEGSQTAILGNGAFAIENIRTCVEHGAAKVYLVTRRKNLPCSRLSCWFVHQAIIPVPAAMLLDTFAPMFQACGFGDPWSYWSVNANKDRSLATISSASRFGIGDVTFLAVACGRCEYVQDLLKRCTRHTLHLQGGRKIEGVTNIIKALGLIADFEADKFHRITEMVGEWPAADFRRIVYVDPVGMHAANFTTMSTGIGSYAFSIKHKYFLDFPAEFRRLQDTGVIDMLPRMRAAEEKPAHMYDAKYANSCGVIIESQCPGISKLLAGTDDYMHTCLHKCCPLDKFYAECKASWDDYQEAWRKQGFEHEYVPYPYTEEMVSEWFTLYEKKVGPSTLERKALLLEHIAEQQAETAAGDGKDSLDWWRRNCERCHEIKGAKKVH